MSEFAGERIAKVIARAGLCSRRDAERLIEGGHVTLNGKTLASAAVNVTPADSIRVDGRLLQMLAAGDSTLSALDARMPKRHITPEYRLVCPEKDKLDIVDKVHEMLVGKGEIVAIDGIRVQFKHGWGVLRASNTEAAVSLRREGARDPHSSRGGLFRAK